MLQVVKYCLSLENVLSLTVAFHDKGVFLSP